MARVLHFFEIVIVLSTCAAVAGFFGRWHFLLDLGSHLRIQWIVVLAMCSIVMALCSRRRWALCSGAVALVLLATVFVPSQPIDKQVSAGTSSGPQYRLYSMNVLSSNTARDQVIENIVAEDPTFIALYETTPTWVAALDLALSQRWPYSQTIPRNDNFGLVLYSKLPWVQCSIRNYSLSHNIPSIATQFELAGKQKLQLIATHPLPPISQAYWQQRNEHFATLANDVANNGPAHSIVAGDLNCSPWSFHFSDLLAASGLLNSDSRRGMHATWNPIGLPLCGLAIDHVLVGSHIDVVERRIGPPMGSDHCPIIIDFQFASNAPPKLQNKNAKGN